MDLQNRQTPEDICAHYGEDYSKHFGAMSPPIYQTSLFLDGNDYTYSRVSNPTLEVFEKKVAALEHASPEEGGRALTVSSGMAAITTAILSCVRAGEHMIMVRTAYGPARGFARYLERFGIGCTFVHGTRVEDFEEAYRPETKLIYLESPCSAIFELQDLAAVADFARAKGIATVIDNTCATPVYQQPLDFGIDLVVHSATKYFGGHSDAVAGVIVGKGERIARLANERTMWGNAAPPMQGWLLQRGLRTLPVRMKAAMENGLAVARYLEAHPKVERVYYPALESFPQHELYLRQMSGCGGLLSFSPRGSYASRAEMVRRLQVFKKAPSWGGYDSLVCPLGALEPPTEETHLAHDGGVIRLYVGLENIETLLEDLEQALEALD